MNFEPSIPDHDEPARPPLTASEMAYNDFLNTASTDEFRALAAYAKAQGITLEAAVEMRNCPKELKEAA